MAGGMAMFLTAGEIKGLFNQLSAEVAANENRALKECYAALDAYLESEKSK